MCIEQGRSKSKGKGFVSFKQAILLDSQVTSLYEKCDFKNVEKAELGLGKEEFSKMLEHLIPEQTKEEKEDSFEELLILEKAEKLRKKQRTQNKFGLKNSINRIKIKEKNPNKRKVPIEWQKKQILSNSGTKQFISSRQKTTQTKTRAPNKKILIKRNLKTAQETSEKIKKATNARVSFILGKKKLKSVRKNNVLEKMERLSRQIPNFIANKFVFVDSRKDLILLNDHFGKQLDQLRLLRLEIRRDFPLLFESCPNFLAEFFGKFTKARSVNFYNGEFNNKKFVVCLKDIRSEIGRQFGQTGNCIKQNKDMQKEMNCLSQLVFLGNFKSFLDSFDSVELPSPTSTKTSWLEQALAKINKCSQNSSDCSLEKKNQFCCGLVHLLQLVVSCELYVSRISLKNMMNIRLVIDCGSLLDMISDSLQKQRMFEFLSSNVQFAHYLDMINRFLVFQIDQYSRLFKQPGRDWQSYSLQKNLKILSKIISKFRTLSNKQLEKISGTSAKVLLFPEKPNMNIQMLLTLIGQSN